jgi:signal peptidase II
LKRNLLLFYTILLVMLVLDQAVKIWARHTFDAGLSVLNGAPWPGKFEFTLTYNKGIAFGMLDGRGIFLAPIAILMAFGAMVYSYRHPKDPAATHIAMALLAAGALGNLYDRLAHGQVTDMFYAKFINFPVFNVADACITCAAILLIWTWTFDSVAKGKTAPVTTDSGQVSS